MSKYDDLFAETSPTDSIFADKSTLDPLALSEEIIAREDQERALATILNGIHEGYLSPTISIHGPSGTGKTMTTRRIAEEFAARTEELAVEYETEVIKTNERQMSPATVIAGSYSGLKTDPNNGLVKRETPL